MATLQQSFNSFLNTPGPSTPRGRGRGGGRGRGSGRGGRGGSSSGGSNLKKSDYSNVPFDYASINSQRYNKMEGFVQPFGPNDSPSNRGSPFPRGRGRGRGGFGATATASPSAPSPRVDSGSSTPVRGIGHRGRGGGLGLGADRGSSGYKGKSTVGREAVMWGGRGAPLFVKGGELFKDGEVDIFKMTEDETITVETVPLSDPSAPQMTNLRDDTEIEIQEDEALVEPPSPEPEVPSETSEQPPPSPSLELEPASPQVPNSETMPEPIMEVETVTVTEESLDQDLAQATSAEEPIPIVKSAHEKPVPMDVEAEVDSLFFVDTAPAPALVEESPFYLDIAPGALASSSTKPMYKSQTRTALGHAPAHVSSDEEIVFAPRQYKQPQPIQVDMAQASGSRSARTRPSPPVPSASAPAPSHPRAMSRAQKKAAKKDKKKGGSKKLLRARRQAELAEASDIEWGSDGPPRGKGAIEGIAESEDDEDDDDVAILQDYLAGTLLNAKQSSDEEMDADEAMDSDEVDEALQLDMMRRFGEGVSRWNETGAGASGSGSGEDSDDDPVLGVGSQDGESDSDEVDMEDVSDSDSGSDSDIEEGITLEEDVEADIDRQLALALEKGEEDSDIEELFTGKSGWGDEGGDEADWFLQSMTDALDPKAISYKNRKSNSKLFHAIENGNFDDFDLSVEPAKKKKNNKHVPPELQAQWDKDRETKAEKKRQRALDRLMAALDPYPASGKKKNKGKGKARDIAQAASIAHLIPASAAEVAEMFDISSGDEDDDPGRWRNKRQGGLLPDITETWMAQVNSQVQAFLEDDGKQTFSLPPMDKGGRMKIHLLAECYGLVSQSKGGGRGRFTILIKNSRSGQIVNHAKINRLIQASQSTGGSFYKSLYGGGGGGKSNGKPNKFDKSNKGKSTAAKGNGNMPSLRARDGEKVGGGAERIGMDNIGHQLLSKMGWADGDRIGRGAGLDQPIVAIVKNTKSGLGA